EGECGFDMTRCAAPGDHDAQPGAAADSVYRHAHLGPLRVGCLVVSLVCRRYSAALRRGWGLLPGLLVPAFCLLPGPDPGPGRRAPPRGGWYGSGADRRNSLPNLPGPCVRSAATASGSCRAQFANSPNIVMVTTIDVPP